MIKYRKMTAVLCCQIYGSVIPGVLKVTLPNALITFGLKYMEVNEIFGVNELLDRYTIQPPAWSAFSGLLGFFLVFRLQQAYARYYTGYTNVQLMVAAWFDTVSSVFAFVRDSKSDPHFVNEFKHTLVRLISILNALSLLGMQGDRRHSGDVYRTFDFVELIGFGDLDHSTVEALKRSKSKAELVYHWIHELLVAGQSSGVISAAPPLLARAFTSLYAGLVAVEDARKLGQLPFPFPYAQAGYWILIIHWIITPVNMCFWTRRPETSAFFSFLSTFIFWSMHKICSELENPFGCGANDVDCRETQDRLNKQLLMLLDEDAFHVPHLRDIRRASISSPRIRSSTANDFSDQFDEPPHMGERKMSDLPDVFNDQHKDHMLCSDRKISESSNLLAEDLMEETSSDDGDSHSDLEGGWTLAAALQPEGTHSRRPPDPQEGQRLARRPCDVPPPPVLVATTEAVAQKVDEQTEAPAAGAGHLPGRGPPAACRSPAEAAGRQPTQGGPQCQAAIPDQACCSRAVSSELIHGAGRFKAEVGIRGVPELGPHYQWARPVTRSHPCLGVGTPPIPLRQPTTLYHEAGGFPAGTVGSLPAGQHRWSPASADPETPLLARERENHSRGQESSPSCRLLPPGASPGWVPLPGSQPSGG